MTEGILEEQDSRVMKELSDMPLLKTASLYLRTVYFIGTKEMTYQGRINKAKNSVPSLCSTIIPKSFNTTLENILKFLLRVPSS